MPRVIVKPNKEFEQEFQRDVLPNFLRGYQGEPFRFEDFTPEQLASLSFKYEDFTVEQLQSLKGDAGITVGTTPPANPVEGTLWVDTN